MRKVNTLSRHTLTAFFLIIVLTSAAWRSLTLALNTDQDRERRADEMHFQ
jgi:hypothetical protein